MAGQTRVSGVEVDDAAFLEGLRLAFAELKLTSVEQLRGTGIRVANRAKQLAPVDTGRMRAAIGSTEGVDEIGPYVDVGITSDGLMSAGAPTNYAIYVEFGHKTRNEGFVSPQPFMRPALAEEVGYGGAAPSDTAGTVGGA